MPTLWALALAATLVTRSALGADTPAPLLPPPELGAEPPALPRVALEERRPVELGAFGRALAPLDRNEDPALGAGAGVGFRTNPYFSVGVEGSVLRIGAPAARAQSTVELVAVGRVYLLEVGALDPYLELGLGYSVEVDRVAGNASQGPSARAGGGVDWVIASPLRLGALLALHETVRWPSSRCTSACGARREGGLLAGVTLTLPFGEPL